MRISIYQFKIDGKKLNVKDGKIDVIGSLYASTGNCPGLEEYRYDDNMLMAVKLDCELLYGALFSPEAEIEKFHYTPAWNNKGRIYMGVFYQKKYPLIIEMRLDSVWFRIFYCSSFPKMGDFAKIFFNGPTGEVQPIVQQAIMRLNAAIALGDVVLPNLKPTIY